MSYNVAICIPPILAEEAAAWEELDILIQAQGEPPAVFQ